MTETTPFDIEVSRLADETIDLIEGFLKEFTSAPDFLNRHMSAGFLARCVALMRGIAALGDAGLDDLCAVLARVLMEACLLGLYVLLGGVDALNELMGDYQRNVKILADRNDYETLNELVLEWDRATDRVSLEQVAKKLGPLLQAAGDNNANASGLYDAVYRGHSTFAVHGVGTVFRYLLVQDQNVWRVELRPDPGGMTGSVHLILAALHTMYFARIALDRWGYSSDTAANLLDRIAVVADVHAPTSPATRGQGQVVH
jgi:hypothetical protein